MSEERDYGAEMQEAAEKHVAACFEAMHMYESGVEAEDVMDPAMAPFDGCDTCVAREVIYAVWPLMKEAIEAGVELDLPRCEDA